MGGKNEERKKETRSIETPPRMVTSTIFGNTERYSVKGVQGIVYHTGVHVTW